MANEPTHSSGLEATVPVQDSGTDATVPAQDKDGGAPVAAPPADQRYRLGAELGRGGMGRVVEAFDTHLGRTVALKEVLPQHSANMAKRFQREVRITARLEHASIVPLYDSGVMADGRPYYVMRRVTGKPLDELIARSRTLEERLALLPNVLAAIDAMAHAHRRGVIHRDIKPANILVGELGETVVIDWGLAKVIGEEEPPPPSFENLVPTAADSLQTHVGSVFGTPGFMAPEQARGDELGPQSDVFALGATLYQMIAGRPPVTGTSATQVIVSTIMNKIVPVSTVAPGAPPELATIIAKALAFETDNRYRDASELAEDVRRFLTGQLVGAHRYTRMQRLARFARRHRAALSVAALAATAVAVLSWFSVHRIMKERDDASSARAEADQQRVLAVQKATESRQRADQLLLAQTRALAEKNPTAAIAALKSMEPTTPAVLAEAKAIAKGAVARGVAWGVPTLPNLTTSFAITRDGKRLLQANRDGLLQVIDLDLRKQIEKLDAGAGARGMWVAGDRLIFVDRGKQPPAIFDPASRTLDPIADVSVSEFTTTESGDVIVYSDDKNQLGIIDVAKRTATPLWTKSNASDPRIAPDGSWVAFVEKPDPKTRRLVIIDRNAKILAERAGNAVTMAVSPAGKLAVSFYGEIMEVKPTEAKPTFAKVTIDPKEAQTVISLAYRGEYLQMVSGKNVLSWNGVRLVRSDDLGGTAFIASEVIDGIVAVVAGDQAIHLLRDGLHLPLQLPSGAQGMVRMAAARGAPRIAATTKDAIVVWDLPGLLPPVEQTFVGRFIANRRTLVHKGDFADSYVWDLDTKQSLPVKSDVHGMPIVSIADPAESRIVQLVNTGPVSHVVDVRADGTTTMLVPDIGNGRFDAIEGNAIVYSVGKNKLFGKVGSEAARELVSLDGEIWSIASRGKHAYAALSAAGELVKGTFGGGDFQRTKLPDLDKHAFIAADHNHDVLIASGNRLLRWRGDVHEVARFATPINMIESTKLGVYVNLTDGSVMFLPATGNQTPQRVPIGKFVAIADEGRLVVGMTASTQLELVDMPGLARWTLPSVVTNMQEAFVAPDGKRIVQSLVGYALVWKVPAPASDFAAWLDEVTNADDQGGKLHWPWQP